MSPQALPSLVTLDDIRNAAERIRLVARVTPLVPASATSRSGPVWLKCENLQVAGSFKIRGAANMVAQLGPVELGRGVITYSSGNHGQALACAARPAGAPAVVVMPTTAPAVKVAGARGFGAEVVFAGTTSAERKAEAERLAAARGLVIVPPFDHPAIVAGQGTVGLEIVEACPGVEEIYVPLGGGGLLSGVAAAVKALRPAVRVVGVEPAGAPKMSASLRAGAPVTLERVSSIADGLLPVRPGDLTYAHVRAFVDEVVTVEEGAFVDAMRLIASEAKLVVEPSGAAGVAAILQRYGALAAVPVTAVAVLSGGNVALDRFAQLVSATA